MNENLSFEELVKNATNKNNGDAYWSIVICKYFLEDLKMDEERAKKEFSRFLQHEEILNDFTKYLSNNSFDFESKLKVKGMSAKEVHEKNPALNAFQVYSILMDQDPLLTIKLNERHYNGAYSKGSIFKTVIDFVLTDRNASSTITINFCIDEAIKEKAKIQITVPFMITEEETTSIKQLLQTISSNPDYVYQESHYAKNKFDPKKFKYTDVSIDDKEYEILTQDEILTQLKTLIHYESVAELVLEAYNHMTK